MNILQAAGWVELLLVLLLLAAIVAVAAVAK